MCHLSTSMNMENIVIRILIKIIATHKPSKEECTECNKKVGLVKLCKDGINWLKGGGADKPGASFRSHAVPVCERKVHVVMLRFIQRSVVQRAPWRVLRQSSGTVEMEVSWGSEI